MLKQLSLGALLLVTGLTATACEEPVPSEDTITKQDEGIKNPPRPLFTTTNDYLYVDKVEVEGVTYHCITNGYDTEAMQCFKVESESSSTSTTMTTLGYR